MTTFNKIILIIILSLIAVATYGQSNRSKNKRPIYKEIQKVSERPAEDETLKNVVTVGSPVWTISKRVQVVSNRYDIDNKQGNVVSKGTPDWVISKGIHKVKKGRAKTIIPSKPDKVDIVKKDR